MKQFLICLACCATLMISCSKVLTRTPGVLRNDTVTVYVYPEDIQKIADSAARDILDMPVVNLRILDFVDSLQDIIHFRARELVRDTIKTRIKEQLDSSKTIKNLMKGK